MFILSEDTDLGTGTNRNRLDSIKSCLFLAWDRESQVIYVITCTSGGNTLELDPLVRIGNSQRVRLA